MVQAKFGEIRHASIQTPLGATALWKWLRAQPHDRPQAEQAAATHQSRAKLGYTLVYRGSW